MNRLDFKDDKVKNMLDDLYKDFGKSIFEDVDVYKIYSDMIDVDKKPVSDIKRRLIDFPLTNVYEAGKDKQFVIYDIICPGVSKDKLQLSIEIEEDRIFMCITGIPWYETNSPETSIKTEILIGDVFIKKYDITHYNIDINTISSKYKDGILSITLPKKAVEDKIQNLKIKIL